MDKLPQGGQSKPHPSWYELYYNQLVSTLSELRYPVSNVRGILWKCRDKFLHVLYPLCSWKAFTAAGEAHDAYFCI